MVKILVPSARCMLSLSLHAMSLLAHYALVTHVTLHYERRDTSQQRDESKKSGVEERATRARRAGRKAGGE